MATGCDAGGGVGEEKGRRRKVELVQEAIHGLLEEKRRKQQQQQQQQQQQLGAGEEGSMVHQDQEEDHLLSSLLSKLDALENDGGLNHVEPNSFHPNSETRYGESSKEVELGDIAKDLNKIKRQNMITHILLGTVIVMTAVWQFNEVSFLLAVQRKLSNPFKSLGDLIKGSLKRGKKPVMEGSPLPPVGIPDISRSDLPTLVIGSDDGSIGE